jgi:Na+/H+ antiporter NhaD/arsenite permease-like protein
MTPSADAAGVTMDAAFWVATVIFLVSYAFIISEKIHKTIVALMGASLLLIFKILDQGEAFHLETLGVDWNVIFLLVGMMLIVILMRPTGVFEYIAIKSARVGKGEP